MDPESKPCPFFDPGIEHRHPRRLEVNRVAGHDSQAAMLGGCCIHQVGLRKGMADQVPFINEKAALAIPSLDISSTGQLNRGLTLFFCSHSSLVIRIRLSRRRALASAGRARRIWSDCSS